MWLEVFVIPPDLYNSTVNKQTVDKLIECGKPSVNQPNTECSRVIKVRMGAQ